MIIGWQKYFQWIWWTGNKIQNKTKSVKLVLTRHWLKRGQVWRLIMLAFNFADKAENSDRLPDILLLFFISDLGNLLLKNNLNDFLCCLYVLPFFKYRGFMVNTWGQKVFEKLLFIRRNTCCCYWVGSRNVKRQPWHCLPAWGGNQPLLI